MSRLSKQEPYRELNETSPSTAPSTTDELKQAFDTHKIPVADDLPH
ncbi:hypothetical protein [Mycetohabitans rhizoxinica]|nr:hypothetical protein [Mycetohabitans rhizoxinica]